MPHLLIVIASTRPGRVGLPLGEWFAGRAADHRGLKNAIDHLHHEWANKPAGFVSYGGVSAGTRAVSALKPVVSAVRMLPVADAVHVPFVADLVRDGEVHANDVMLAAADTMLDELLAAEAVLSSRRRAAAPAAS